MNRQLPEFCHQLKRIEAAKYRLRCSGIPMNRIAEDLGFPSFHYFSVLFKKITGLTPGAYRMMNDVSESAVCRFIYGITNTFLILESNRAEDKGRGCLKSGLGDSCIFYGHRVSLLNCNSQTECFPACF